LAERSWISSKPGHLRDYCIGGDSRVSVLTAESFEEKFKNGEIVFTHSGDEHTVLRLITNVFESLMSKSTTYGVCDFVHWSVVKTMLPKFRKLEAVTFHDVSFWNEEDAREMGEISGQTSTLEYLGFQEGLRDEHIHAMQPELLAAVARGWFTVGINPSNLTAKGMRTVRYLMGQGVGIGKLVPNANGTYGITNW